jgi:hypothetical protein
MFTNFVPIFCRSIVLQSAAFLQCTNTSTLMDGIALNIKHLTRKNSKTMDSVMKYVARVTAGSWQQVVGAYWYINPIKNVLYYLQWKYKHSALYDGDAVFTERYDYNVHVCLSFSCSSWCWVSNGSLISVSNGSLISVSNGSLITTTYWSLWEKESITNCSFWQMNKNVMR